jgi:hypothetical protein
MVLNQLKINHRRVLEENIGTDCMEQTTRSVHQRCQEVLDEPAEKPMAQCSPELSPGGHVFRTTVYLILGYDNFVYGENIALNLNFWRFHVDHREAFYYLIHELAHAGYFRYRQMPDLAGMRTLGELVDAVKLLTHLEGMGVISPMNLRLEEDGLLDNDYRVLLNYGERHRRVRDYFDLLSRLENRRIQELHEEDLQVFEQMSGRTTRLWYITGCHMAQRIEQECGVEMLRNLVKRGHQEFFETYRNLENPSML